jgi:hypothetical protein
MITGSSGTAWLAGTARRVIGSEAGEVMAVIQTAMLAELPYTRLPDAVIAHLTVAEGLGPLFEGVPLRAP